MNQKGSLVLELIFSFGVFALVVGLILAKVWLWGSLMTSSVKTLSDDCGETYGIEGKLINGDWFCSKDK